MTSESVIETFSVPVIGKLRGMLLLAVAGCCVAAGLAVGWWNIRMLDWGSAARVQAALPAAAQAR
jgi:hypothetical protein